MSTALVARSTEDDNDGISAPYEINRPATDVWAPALHKKASAEALVMVATRIRPFPSLFLVPAGPYLGSPPRTRE